MYAHQHHILATFLDAYTGAWRCLPTDRPDEVRITLDGWHFTVCWSEETDAAFVIFDRV